MEQYNILIVEDDKEIRDGIEIFLKSQNYNVYKAADGIEGLEIIESKEIHLAIVDIMMPRMDGVTMTLKLREHHDFPVIMLSAKSEETDKVIGLNIGADDYVTKPFTPLELMARVNSQIRRYTKFNNKSQEKKENDRVHIIGGIELNEDTVEVFVDGKPVKMTPIEFKILALLMKNPGRVYSADEIYERVWNEKAINTDTIMVHVRNIRDKIEINPREPKYLKVVWGVGYKMENSRKARIVITAGFLLVLAVINFLCYPGINRRSKDWMQKTEAAKTGTDSDTQIRTQFLKNLYEGFYLLDLEYQNQKSETEMSATDLYIASYAKADETDRWESQEQLEQVTNDEVLSVMDEWSSQFEKIRSQIDYCVMESEDGSKLKNTTQNLESVLGGEEKNVSEQLAQYYSELFAVKFNEVGAMEVIPLLSDRENSGDLLVKSLGAQERSELLKTNLEEYFNPTDMPVLKGPENIEFVIGISKEKASENILYDSGSDEEEDYFEKLSAYKINGALPLYGASVVAVIAFMFFMTGKKAGGNILNDGKVHAYAAELGVTGVICGLCLQNYFMELIWSYGFDSFSDAADELMGGQVYDVVISVLTVVGTLWLIYAMWFAAAYLLRPVFSVGLWEYVKRYSLVYQIFPWIKKQFKKTGNRIRQWWNTLSGEITHIDFSEETTKLILKVVVINFAVLAACSLFWFFGIGALVVYSIVLFFIIKKHYEQINKDYHAMLDAMQTIAEGNLDQEIQGDFGIFNPFRDELAQIQTGMKKAVEEEVKSQRMKTELITNVSHDLKTPLTAITTYIELLKKEDITEEERRSYIDTLERKSLRLKVLIEDLFEVSKANSNNIVLNKMELDVVNLIKQVSIEHVDKMKERGLELKWNVPEEKVLLMLDNQKTYRIFENLFVNVVKYAMQGSRVYLEVRKKASLVEIILKNMSAEEIHISGDEITERFVRGDSSRNTEGSGLGLAIAKSFTEAQGGEFHVEVDGDLFKVVILF